MAYELEDQLADIDAALMGHSEMYDWETPRGLALLAMWAKNGMSMAEMSKRTGVSAKTWKRWAVASPDIYKALYQSYEVSKAEVEAALYKRALGYDATFERREYAETPKGVIDKTVSGVNHIPPDVNAIKFWLTNTDPANWGDKLTVDVHSFDKQAEDVLEVMDQAISALGLTPDQRARLPELIRNAAIARGLVNDKAKELD